MYAPLRLELDFELSMDAHLPVEATSTTIQIDIGRVFRGKSDKKCVYTSSRNNHLRTIPSALKIYDSDGKNLRLSAVVMWDFIKLVRSKQKQHHFSCPWSSNLKEWCLPFSFSLSYSLSVSLSLNISISNRHFLHHGKALVKVQSLIHLWRMQASVKSFHGQRHPCSSNVKSLWFISM